MGATVQDLSLYLGQDVDPDRAALFIALAEQQCAAYVDPVPDAAIPIVLKVAAQGITNPVAVHTQHAGPFSVGMPATAQAGSALSRADIRQLRLLSGRGSAFSIDPTPLAVATGAMPWDENVEWLEGTPLADAEDMDGGA